VVEEVRVSPYILAWIAMFVARAFVNPRYCKVLALPPADAHHLRPVAARETFFAPRLRWTRILDLRGPVAAALPILEIVTFREKLADLVAIDILSRRTPCVTS
jgi:hypothetical protein